MSRHNIFDVLSALRVALDWSWTLWWVALRALDGQSRGH